MHKFYDSLIYIERSNFYIPVVGYSFSAGLIIFGAILALAWNRRYKIQMLEEHPENRINASADVTSEEASEMDEAPRFFE